jgi:glycine dehydrogenase subunit 1
VQPAFPEAPFFKEFALRTDVEPAEVQRRLIDDGFLAGPVCEVGPKGTDGTVLMVAVTERRTRDEIDRFVAAFGKAASS